MTITIENLTFKAIIGILKHERDTPQPINIDCKIEYNYGNGEFLDYVRVVDTIQSSIIEGKFYLIEDAIESIFIEIKKKFPQVKNIKIKISKPDILPNCRVCVSDSRSYL